MCLVHAGVMINGLPSQLGSQMLRGTPIVSRGSSWRLPARSATGSPKWQNSTTLGGAAARPLSNAAGPRAVHIAGCARTPIGAFCGSLAGLSAQRLGAAAISAALRKAGLEPEEVDAVVMGQALPAGCGQNPVRQAAMLAGIPPAADCTGISKGCASGLKAVAIGAQMIATGQADVVITGGMESMSQAPYYQRNTRTSGLRYGHSVMEDACLLDGLTDPFEKCHLGVLAEAAAREFGITREDQDRYTISSYRRAADAWQRGGMDLEVAPVRVAAGGPSTGSVAADQGKANIVSCDEDYSRLRIDTVASLPPVFEDDGTITAASASSLNDGAAVIVLISQEKAKYLDLVNVVGRVASFADQGCEPTAFAKAPAGAVRKALAAAGRSSVEYYEIHETFAVVPIINAHLLDLDHSRMNVNGGGVSLGHPIGASGARILCTLMSVLDQRSAGSGCAAIGNGGAGATALVVETL